VLTLLPHSAVWPQEQREVELVFESLDDTNGMIYNIGTHNNTTSFQVPFVTLRLLIGVEQAQL
jgi:hypothetical protein